MRLSDFDILSPENQQSLADVGISLGLVTLLDWKIFLQTEMMSLIKMAIGVVFVFFLRRFLGWIFPKNKTKHTEEE